MKSLIDVKRELRSRLESRIDAVANRMVTGQCGSLEAYKFQAGIASGLSVALDEVTSVFNKLVEDDDE